MKDIYDIIFIAAHHSFALQILSDAVTATFSQRGTLPEARSTVFDGSFAGNRDRMKQWSAFVGLQSEGTELLFSDAIERLRRFIAPVFDPGRIQSYWHPESWQWLPLA